MPITMGQKARDLSLSHVEVIQLLIPENEAFL